MVSPIVVNIIGNTKQLEAALATSGTKMAKWKAKATAFGAGMTKFVTVPLVAAGAGLVVLGNKFDKSTKTIRAGTGATGRALEGLDKSFKKVFSTLPVSMEDASNAIADVNTRLGLTGVPLERVTSQLLRLSKVTGVDVKEATDLATRSFGDFSVATKDQPKALDFLWKTVQTTGTEFSKLSTIMTQYGAPMRLLNMSFEEGATLVGKFNKEGVNTELVLGGLKQMIAKVTAAGGDPAAVFEGLKNRIQAAGDVSKVAGEDLKMFGARAGPDVAAAILEGRFELDELYNTISRSGETLGAAESETRTLGDSLRILGNRAAVALAPLGEDLVKVFEKDVMPIFEKVVGAFSKLAEWFSKLDPGVKKLIVGFLMAAAVIGPLILIGLKVASMIGAIAGAIGFLLSPIGLIILGISALVAGFIIAYQKSEGFRNFIQKLVGTFKKVASFVKDVLVVVWNEHLLPALRKVKESFGRIIKALQPAFPLFKKLGKIIAIAIGVLVAGPIIAFFAALVGGIIVVSKVIGFLAPIIAKVIEVIVTLVTTVWGILQPAFAFIVSVLGIIWQAFQIVATIIGVVSQIVLLFAAIIIGTIIAIAEVIGSIWSFLWDNILSKIVEIATVIGTKIAEFFAPLIEWFNRAKDVAIEVWNKIKEVMGSAWEWINSNVIEPFKGALEGLKEVWRGIWDGMKGILEGAVNAIIDGINWMGRKLRDGVNAAADGVNKITDKVPIIGDKVKIGTMSWNEIGHVKFHKGGLVPGSDELAATLLGGEFVLTREQTKALGLDREKVGGPFDIVKHWGSKIISWVDRLLEGIKLARPPITSAKNTFLSGAQGFATNFSGGAAFKAQQVLSWLDALKEGTQGLGVGSGWQSIVSFLRRTGIGFGVSSTVRPGSKTRAKGTLSLHALGRAVDLTGPNMMEIFNTLAAVAGNWLQELIYSPAPFFVSRGRRVPIGALDSITRADHFDHVHAGTFDNGGWLQPGLNLAWNGTGSPEPVGDVAGTTINLTVNAGMGTNGSEVGYQVVEALRRYQRTNGGIPIRVTDRG